MPFLITVMPVLIGLAIMYFVGRFCSQVADTKGYDPRMFFWIGFFFPIPTLIIISLLPEHRS